MLIGLSSNLSLLATVPDRMQQAYLDFMFPGRAMIRASGLSALPAFRNGAHSVIVARPSLAYVGYSLSGRPCTCPGPAGADRPCGLGVAGRAGLDR